MDPVWVEINRQEKKPGETPGSSRAQGSVVVFS